MKKLYLFLIVVLLAFASCTNERIPIDDTGNYGTITASIEQRSTKSRLVVQQDNSLEWTVGDVIRVFMSNGESYDYKHTGNDVFEAVSQTIPNGTSNDDVVGVLYEGYDDEGSFVSGSVTGNTLESYFAQNVTYQTISENTINLPMWGTWNNGHISFKHLAGILRVNLTNLPLGYDMLSVIASNPIAGKAVVEDVTINDPVLVMNESGENLVNVRFTETSEGAQNKTIYIPLPVGTYESIKVIVSKYDENLAEGEFQEPLELAYWRKKTVERATIYTGSVAYTEVSDIASLNSVLQNVSDENKNAHVIVSEEISGTGNEVTIPEVTNSIVTLNFSKVADNTSLTINSGEGESTSASQNIAVNVGNESTETIELTLNTPTSTVELEAGNFSTITATTATNTLIINGGVTINKLIINGGNVLIEAGVVIREIVNNANVVIDYIARSENSLRTAFEKGGEYKVYEDIIINDVHGVKVGENKSVVLNLNDKKITANGNVFVVESGTTLTLNGNGIVKAGNTIGSWNAVCANGGQVTINGGNYSVGLDDSDSNSCIYVENGGKVIINAGEFSHEIPTTGNNSGMPLQADNDTEGKIIVNGGVFVLDNGYYYEQQDLNADKIEIIGTETRDDDKMMVSDAIGATIVIENKGLSQALYELFSGTYYIKLNDDGYAEMIESEVNSISKINLTQKTPYREITDLNGIEKFKNLEKLKCEALLNLETCDLSQNSFLKSLELMYNEKLTSLNLNGCFNLESLGINGCTSLVSVNISKDTKENLSSLFLGHNELNFNLSEFPNLLSLEIVGKGLMDLSIIPNEMKQRLNYLNVLENQLKSVDLSEFPNLVRLECLNNQITDIKNLSGSNLTELYCMENQITELDLTNSNLTILDCSYNQITELDFSGCPKLSVLGCEYNKIEFLDITPCEGLYAAGCGNQLDNIQITLTLTENQKTILVDNGQMNLENHRITLNVVQ